MMSAERPEPPPTGAVHVIDDDAAVVQGIALLLQAAGFETITHDSAAGFLERLGRMGEAGIACVLTDLRMPGLDGFGLLRRLRECGFTSPVIAMTAFGDIATAVRAMKEGADDFIEKPFDDDDLLRAISGVRRSAARQAAADDSAPAASDGTGRGQTINSRVAALPPRERAVLDLIVLGDANKMIAAKLGISQRTVEGHRARLMARLGARSLADLVRLVVGGAAAKS